jgi:hypothetical protein
MLLYVFFACFASFFFLGKFFVYVAFNWNVHVLQCYSFCWSNASLFCYIVLQCIGCFVCFVIYFLFSLCCCVGVVKICILSSLLSIVRRSWSSYSPILASFFFLLYFVEMCISYGVLVCCISLKCAFLTMVFFFVECVIVWLLCATIHYSCNALTCLNFYFYFLKKNSLLLWVLCCFIYCCFFFFFVWIWIGDILKKSLHFCSFTTLFCPWICVKMDNMCL